MNTDYIIAHLFSREVKKDGTYLMCESTASGSEPAPFDGITCLFKLGEHDTQAKWERKAIAEIQKSCPGFHVEAVAYPNEYNDARRASDVILKKNTKKKSLLAKLLKYIGG